MPYGKCEEYEYLGCEKDLSLNMYCGGYEVKCCPGRLIYQHREIVSLAKYLWLLAEKYNGQLSWHKANMLIKDPNNLCLEIMCVIEMIFNRYLKLERDKLNKTNNKR